MPVLTMASTCGLGRMVSFMLVRKKLPLRIPRMNLRGVWIELINEIFHWMMSTTMMPLEMVSLSSLLIVVFGPPTRSLVVDLVAVLILLAKAAIVQVVVRVGPGIEGGILGAVGGKRRLIQNYQRRKRRFFRR